MEHKKTMTMNWKGVDDEHFFESLDGASSSDDDEDFQESRMSFSANSQKFSVNSKKFSVNSKKFSVDSQRFSANSKKFSVDSQRFRIISRKASTAPVAVPIPDFDRKASIAPMGMAIPDFDYSIWMAAPGSITERRKRLLYGMGLTDNKESLRLASIAIGRAMTRKFDNNATPLPPSSDKPKETTVSEPRDAAVVIATEPVVTDTAAPAAPAASCDDQNKTENETVYSPPPEEHRTELSPVPFVLVRSRSDGDVDFDSYTMPKMRKEELIGMVTKTMFD